MEGYPFHQATDRLFFPQSEYRSLKNLSLEILLYQKAPEKELHLVNINGDFRLLSPLLKVGPNSVVNGDVILIRSKKKKKKSNLLIFCSKVIIYAKEVE